MSISYDHWLYITVSAVNHAVDNGLLNFDNENVVECKIIEFSINGKLCYYYLHSLDFGEVEVVVAYGIDSNFDKTRFLQNPDSIEELHSCDIICKGWLERRHGKYLQSPPEITSSVFHIINNDIALNFASAVSGHGYTTEGIFIQ